MFILMVDPLPSPTASECSTMISYANSLHSKLVALQDTFAAVASEPDQSILFLKEQIADMISKASTVSGNLYTIQANANKYAEEHQMIPGFGSEGGMPMV